MCRELEVSEREKVSLDNERTLLLEKVEHLEKELVFERRESNRKLSELKSQRRRETRTPRPSQIYGFLYSHPLSISPSLSPFFALQCNYSENKSFQNRVPSQPSPNNVSITRYFEVTKPIELPKTKPCSYLILQHDFGNTYGNPPVLAEYKPPSDCPSQDFSKIVLEWKATCKGRQFDRIFGVWLGGVEILRSCTAEPRATGIVWTVEKDITRYFSLLKNPQRFSVYMGNIVDQTYTGIYHVNVTFHFYPGEVPQSSLERQNSVSGFDFPADLVIPISRNLPLNDGLWFLIENSTDVQKKKFKIPRNAYRAVLEVYVSFHSDDESWYTNPPNNYVKANNLTNVPGNGPFREVVVRLDERIVGAIWPFTVIYTGGINPLLWRPITGIGSFNLPSYDIEITPFLGKILDGDQHNFGFSVTNALSVWFIDANLHVWLDSKNERTRGKLMKHKSSHPQVSLVSHFKGVNGSFLINARRSIISSGWVKSSHGKIITYSFQNFSFTNSMEMKKNLDLQIVSQAIEANRSVLARLPSTFMYYIKSMQRFPFYLYSDNVNQGNGSFTSLVNLSLGFNEDKFSDDHFGFSMSSLRNLQNGKGNMLVKGNLVVSGLGSTQQVYAYDSNEECYFRNVSSKNYTVLYDEKRDLCDRKSFP
ncbi:peptide-N4-(N-acetyl-beta-glucosaminyl)asparagine amidase A-like [Macadamia integrifolia]|uniref:peptide-N4-(N-acetyl-beta- glucosaminyl)asparagine amidase A-like n=1 Tax=Macadamia integrifolia TaxID=60698 RepID=UPI001C4E5B8C|nr:peptide-N4-(N-acetyl-beta-glucosaminyl)asparagine amidase A-like [Macadamia integrifolia]